MFRFYIFTFVLIHLTFASDRNNKLQLNGTTSHEDSLLHIASPYESSPKSYLFDRIMLKDVNYKPKYHFTSGRSYGKKSCLQKPHLNVCKGKKAQLTNCMHTRNSLRTFINSEEKLSNPDVEEKDNTFGSFHRDISFVRQSAIHTLKDLIKNHILNQPKTLSKDYQSKKDINTSDSVIQNEDLQNEPVKYTSIMESGSYIPLNNDITLKIERPSLKNMEKTFIIDEINEKPDEKQFRKNNFTNNHIPMILENKSVLPNGEVTKIQDVDKNARNQTFKEIMIIEIPIKSPMKDKNILLDLNDLKNMQLPLSTFKLSSEEITKNQNNMIDEIERRIENKMITHLEKFKCDIVATLDNMLNKKYGDKSGDNFSTKNVPKKTKHDSNDTTNTKGKCDVNNEHNTDFLKNKIPIPKNNSWICWNTSQSEGDFTKTFPLDMKEYTTEPGGDLLDETWKVTKNKMEICSTTTRCTTQQTSTNNIDACQNPSSNGIGNTVSSRQSTLNNSCVCDQSEGTSKYDHEHCGPKSLVALYDIDLKQPSQLCLVPKDFLQKITNLKMNVSEVQKMSDIFPFINLKPKKLNNNRSENLLKDLHVMKIQLRSPSQKLKSRLYNRQRNRGNKSSPVLYRISSSRGPIVLERNKKENWMSAL